MSDKKTTVLGCAPWAVVSFSVCYVSQYAFGRLSERRRAILVVMAAATAAASVRVLPAAVGAARGVGGAAVLRRGRAHSLVDLVGFTFGAIRNFVDVANEFFKTSAAFLANIFVNRHLPIPSIVYSPRCDPRRRARRVTSPQVLANARYYNTKETPTQPVKSASAFS